MQRRRTLMAVVSLSGLLFAGGCDRTNEPWVLPDASAATEWFGPGTEARLDGNVLEIRGTMEADHLRRGGRIWARGGPYFFLFNVHVQKLLTDYPDLAGVRVLTFDAEGDEVARAMVTRDGLTPGRWNEALARASLAQRDGGDNPRVIEQLIEFGEEHTEYRYSDLE